MSSSGQLSTTASVTSSATSSASSALRHNRCQTRSLSPNILCSPSSSHSSSSSLCSTDQLKRKALKTDKNSDCKSDTKSSSISDDADNSNSNDASNTEPEPQDCPAFRLRPRRSTPKPTPSPGKRFSPFTAMMNRLKYLKDSSSAKRKLLFNKQKVYPSTFNSEDLILARVIPPRSPSCSITEEIFVSPFVQKISPFELEADREYGANYLCLRIIFREEMATNDSDDQSVLKLVASEVESSDIDRPSSSSSKSTKVSERKIAIYLYGSYANCKAEVNKVINIVKFKTQSTLDDGIDVVDGDFPYAIVVKSCGDSWVPFVSITSKWKAPEDPRELNRTLLLTPPDERLPKQEVTYVSATTFAKK